MKAPNLNSLISYSLLCSLCFVNLQSVFVIVMIYSPFLISLAGFLICSNISSYIKKVANFAFQNTEEVISTLCPQLSIYLKYYPLRSGYCLLK